MVGLLGVILLAGVKWRIARLLHKREIERLLVQEEEGCRLNGSGSTGRRRIGVGVEAAVLA